MRLHQCTARRLCRRCMVIWALNTVPASAGHRCPALLPTCEIAGKGVRAPAAAERAPWIRIRRLRLAKLRFAQQAGGYDKKRDDQHAHHISPCRCFRLPLILSVLPGGRNERPGGGLQSRSSPPPPAASAACPCVISRWPVAGGPLRGDACKPVRGTERDFDARTIGWISGQNLDRIGSPCLLAMLKSCPPR
jgi:hypothetical protein